MKSIENLKILYVEDDSFARDEMAHFLNRRAGKVYAAKDGLDGLEQFQMHHPDITIVDLLMPRMDGMEMIRNIRKQDKSAHVVIVTSVNSVDSVIEAVDLGIDSYIVKPLDFSELELKLCKIGDSIQAERGRIQGPLDAIAGKRSMEDQIKKATVKIIREFTGKGPRELIVQLIGRYVKITVLGGITIMEENLLKDRKNLEMVKHQRTVAYEEMEREMSVCIEKVLGHTVKSKQIGVCLKKNMDRITFEIS